MGWLASVVIPSASQYGSGRFFPSSKLKVAEWVAKAVRPDGCVQRPPITQMTGGAIHLRAVPCDQQVMTRLVCICSGQGAVCSHSLTGYERPPARLDEQVASADTLVWRMHPTAPVRKVKRQSTVGTTEPESMLRVQTGCTRSPDLLINQHAPYPLVVLREGDGLHRWSFNELSDERNERWSDGDFVLHGCEYPATRLSAYGFSVGSSNSSCAVVLGCCVTSWATSRPGPFGLRLGLVGRGAASRLLLALSSCIPQNHFMCLAHKPLR